MLQFERSQQSSGSYVQVKQKLMDNKLAQRCLQAAKSVSPANDAEENDSETEDNGSEPEIDDSECDIDQDLHDDNAENENVGDQPLHEVLFSCTPYVPCTHSTRSQTMIENPCSFGFVPAADHIS